MKTLWLGSMLVVLTTLLARGTVLAANNPLNTIPANTFDLKAGEVKTEPCSEGGEDLYSIHNGNYLVYKNYDFDSGVAAFKARVAGTSDGYIEIKLDSLNGPLMGICRYKGTGGPQKWEDACCGVDNSLAGVRDIYLIFHGNPDDTLADISSFAFLKSVVIDGTNVLVGAVDRVDNNDDEQEGVNSWGMPETGFTDDFKSGNLTNWLSSGILPTSDDAGHWVKSSGTNLCYAFTPNVYINKTDTGGDWRDMAEAALSADIIVDSKDAHPGIGFISRDGKQSVYVVLNVASNTIEAWRKLSDGSLTEIARHPKPTNVVDTKWVLQTGIKYRLQVDWSPYSDGLICFLKDDKGNDITSFRTAIDLPAARRPLMFCSGGDARFGDVKFDPTIDSWDFKWQWKKYPVLTPDVCNPAVWKWTDGKYYMMWRKFGKDTYHGIASSTDGVHWTRITDKVLKCTGDMNVLVNPFGDGLVYITPGGANMPWWTSDGSNHFRTWTKTQMTLGNIFGNSRIQEFIDTKQYSQMRPVRLNGMDYRFIAFTENWIDAPQPHTVVLLSNTLTNWVLANPAPVIPPGTNFWGEKGNAVGSAFVLPDGNILLADCSCTFDGYTGASEPSNVSVIVDGKQPWKVLKVGTLPNAPVSRESVWYQGPNFGTAFYYEPQNDTLYFYGGFHDYSIGMMRVQNFSQSAMFLKEQQAAQLSSNK